MLLKILSKEDLPELSVNQVGKISLFGLKFSTIIVPVLVGQTMDDFVLNRNYWNKKTIVFKISD
jgi:hypothetical protein